MLAAFPLAILLALLASMVVVTPVYGSGDSLTLQITNGSSFPYNTCVNLKTTLQLAVKLKEGILLSITLKFSTGKGFGFIQTSESADGLTYTFITCPTSDGTNQFTPGSYTATASFTNPDTGIQTTSNTVSFTYTRGTRHLVCVINSASSPITPGAPLSVKITLTDKTPPVGDQFTMKFKGPITVTSPPLSSDASGTVYLSAPSERGTYGVSCNFLGDSLYIPMTESLGSMLVTLNQKLGGAQLYTNPTTLKVNHPAEMYIVFKAAPGGPAPTGYLIITIGSFSTGTIPLGSGGATLVKLANIPYLPSPPSVRISYDGYGDSYYGSQSFTFPGTNPPIPGSGGGGGGGGGGGSSPTPTATGAATGTATASVTPGATATTGSGVAMNAGGGAGPSGNNTPLWLIGALGLLAVLGAGIGYFILRRRRQRPVAAPAEMERAEALDH